jgi:GNAT superfamily N-acetyltransferase
MSIVRRWTAYKYFLQQEFSAPAPSLGWRLAGFLRTQPSKCLVMLDERAYRERDYIQITLHRRRRDVRTAALHGMLYNKLDQKLWLDRVMPEAAPPVTHYVAGDRLVGLDGGGARGLDALLGLLAEKRELFLKPSGQGQGIGAIRLVQQAEGILVNGTPTQPGTWLAAFTKDRRRANGYIVSDIIRQGRWADAFFSGTLNTLRVLTGTHLSDHRPVLLAATMKTGRPSTYPTDNWKSGRGGVAALVDVETGALARGLFYNKQTRRRDFMDRHPDSGTPFIGNAVPDWPLVRSRMLELAALLPFPGIVGWDVALTDGGITIVEANTTPGLDIHQCHASLKAREEQRAFWKELHR